jgi:hypothetical protein
MAALHIYRVGGGVCRFGPGQKLLLRGKQVAARSARLERLEGLLEALPQNNVSAVRAIEPIEFKVGEEFGLWEAPEALPRSLSSILEHLGQVGPDDEANENETEISGDETVAHGEQNGDSALSEAAAGETAGAAEDGSASLAEGAADVTAGAPDGEQAVASEEETDSAAAEQDGETTARKRGRPAKTLLDV